MKKLQINTIFLIVITLLMLSSVGYNIKTNEKNQKELDSLKSYVHNINSNVAELNLHQTTDVANDNTTSNDELKEKLNEITSDLSTIKSTVDQIYYK